MASLAKNENDNTTAGRNTSSIDSKKILRIGISGKRYISKDERDLVYKKIKNAITKIRKEHSTHQFEAYTAIASGADTIFAEVVRNEFHQPLHIILPFPVEEYKKDFDGNDLNEFENLVKLYGISKVINTESPTDNDTRNTAYYEVGKYMADETDEMIFVWDELKPGGKGGTADILGYFSDKKPGKKIHCILVKPREPDVLNDLIMEKYEESDHIAVKKRNVYRRVWKRAIILGWLAALALAINTAFHPVDYELILPLFEFGFVLAVFILVIRAHRRHYHRSYLDHRMKAEKLRLLRSFYHAGVSVIISEQTEKDDNELAILAKQVNETVDEDHKRSKWYSHYVIRSLIKEQAGYHESKIRAIGNKYRNYEGFMMVIAVAFFINLLLYLTSAVLHYGIIHGYWKINHPIDYPHELHIFLSIVLPATYAAAEGFVHFNDWTLLKKFSEFARSGLQECDERLGANPEQYPSEECYKKQSEVLNSVSRVMRNDNRNWNLLLEDKDSYTMVI